MQERNQSGYVTLTQNGGTGGQDHGCPETPDNAVRGCSVALKIFDFFFCICHHPQELDIHSKNVCFITTRAALP